MRDADVDQIKGCRSWVLAMPLDELDVQELGVQSLVHCAHEQHV